MKKKLLLIFCNNKYCSFLLLYNKHVFELFFIYLMQLIN